MTKRRRILIYALGGGCGHLNRSLAFAKAANRQGHAVRILANGRPARLLASTGAVQRIAANDRRPTWGAGTQVIDLPTDNGKSFVAQEVREQLKMEHDLLVVDTFPRGLGGELPAAFAHHRQPRVLVHRDLNPAYIAKYRLAEFVGTQYQCVVVPGESAPWSDWPDAVTTAPWLNCTSSDLLERGEARRRLSLTEADSKALVVVGSGKFDDCKQMAELAVSLQTLVSSDEWSVRFACLENVRFDSVKPIQVREYPLLALHHGIDCLVTGGGYNAVHELQASARPAIGIAFARLYDRQAQRLKQASIPYFDSSQSELATAIAEELQHLPPANNQLPTFNNGAETAVQAIMHLT